MPIENGQINVHNCVDYSIGGKSIDNAIKEYISNFKFNSTDTLPNKFYSFFIRKEMKENLNFIVGKSFKLPDGNIISPTQKDFANLFEAYHSENVYN